MKIWVTSFVARLWQGMAGYGRVWQGMAGWAQKLGRLLLFMTLALRQQWRSTGYIGISQKDTERKAKSMTNPVHMRPVLPQTLVISVPGHRMHLDFTPQFQSVAGKASCRCHRSLRVQHTKRVTSGCQQRKLVLLYSSLFGKMVLPVLQQHSHYLRNAATQLPWLILLFHNKDLPSDNVIVLVLSCTMSPL